MKNAIGKKLTLDEVKALSNGTKVWVESKFPVQNYFLGTKQSFVITDGDGKVKWALAEDFKQLCTAYEWKQKNEMTNLERLLSNIKIYYMAGMLLKNLVHIARYYFDSGYRENYNRKLKFNRIISVANNIIGGLK